MDLTQVEPGQGWLKNINNNFYAISQQFSQESSQSNIVFLDGWQRNTGGPKDDWQSVVVKAPLIGGRTIYMLRVVAYKDMGPNERGNLLVMPEGYQLSGNFLGNFDVQYDGHSGGYVELYAYGNKIGYHFVPNNGAVDGEANQTHRIYMTATITWFA